MGWCLYLSKSLYTILREVCEWVWTIERGTVEYSREIVCVFIRGKWDFSIFFQFSINIFEHLFALSLVITDGIGLAEAVVKGAEVVVGGGEGGGAKTKTNKFLLWWWWCSTVQRWLFKLETTTFGISANLQPWGESRNFLLALYLYPLSLYLYVMGLSLHTWTKHADLLQGGNYSSVPCLTIALNFTQNLCHFSEVGLNSIEE